jgi:hypothetical protein
MPNQDSPSPRPFEPNPAPPRGRDLRIALIEHGSRPLALIVLGLCALFFLLTIKGPLVDLFRRAESVQMGSFQVRVKAIADLADLSKELTGLQSLDARQVQLFLVVAKRRGHITYTGEEATEENLNKLLAAGLLSSVTRETNGSLSWQVSEKGHELHALIFNQLVKAIRGQS